MRQLQHYPSESTFPLLLCRYDPIAPDAPAETVIEEDRELLEDFYGLEEEVNFNQLTPWLLRLILDDRLTVDKKLGMGQIADKLRDEFDVSRHPVCDTGSVRHQC